jgi:hypothetical protein
MIDCKMLPDIIHNTIPENQPVISPVNAHYNVDNNTSSQSHKNNQIDCTSTTTISHHQTNILLSSNNKSSKTLNTKENLLGIPPAASCSTATSESDSNLSLLDGSSESSSLEVKMWQTESMALAPSCSSIASMETSSDEVTCEFMKRFVTTLFTDSTGITLELKHQFGQYARVSLLKDIKLNFTITTIWFSSQKKKLISLLLNMKQNDVNVEKENL